MGEGQGDRGCSCFGSKPVTFTLTLAQCHVGIPIDAQMSLLDGNHLSAGAVERGARSYDRATRTRCRCSVLRAKSALARHGHGGVKVHDCSTCRMCMYSELSSGPDEQLSAGAPGSALMGHGSADLGSCLLLAVAKCVGSSSCAGWVPPRGCWAGTVLFLRMSGSRAPDLR